MKKLLIGLTLFLFSVSANAALHTFDLLYTSNTTAATATGFITIDDTVFPNSGPNLPGGPQPAATLGITAFSITITGAVEGNGTFGLADFSTFFFNRSGTGPYDLSSELVSQAIHSDFNMFNTTAGAPNGVNPNTIATNVGAAAPGENLTLQSMTPRASIPTLSIWGLGLLILLLPLLARRIIKQ